MNEMSDPRAAIASAVDQGVARPSTKMRESPSIAQIAPAMVRALGALHAPDRKDWRSVEVRSEKGSYRFAYATLDAIMKVVRPVLLKEGLCLIQPIITSEKGTPILLTRLLHESGEWMECEVAMTAQGNNPQQFGSVITYLRRYSLNALLNIAGDEDDDGNVAAGNHMVDAQGGQGGQGNQRRNQGNDRPRQPPADQPPAKNLREHAQDQQGKPRTPAVQDDTLPLVTPDGKLHAIGKGTKGQPPVVVWVASWKRAVGMCESTQALSTLRRENGSNLASVSEIHPDAVKEVEEAIEAHKRRLLEASGNTTGLDTDATDDGWPGPDVPASGQRR